MKVWNFALLVSLWAFPAMAQDFAIALDERSPWDLDPNARSDFSAFLAREFSDLRSDLPALEWTEEETLPRSFGLYFFAASPAYRNRKVQCDFLEQVRARMAQNLQYELTTLTRRGAVCIPADLPESQRAEWALSLAEFFWFRPWIVVNEAARPSSLEDLLRAQTGEGGYRRPDIRIGRSIQFDAFGWGMSASELSLFSEDLTLQRYATLANAISLDDGSGAGALGPEAEKYLRDSSFGMLGVFQPSSRIYLSADFAPADLVEILVHEYGHVFHGEQGENVSWDPAARLLTHANVDSVHTEGFAESFTWNVLLPVYRAYPAVKFFHLAKLVLFSRFRPEDPHLLGAAGLAPLFHVDDKARSPDIAPLARSLDLRSYLAEREVDTLAPKGDVSRTVIPIDLSTSSSLDTGSGARTLAPLLLH